MSEPTDAESQPVTEVRRRVLDMTVFEVSDKERILANGSTRRGYKIKAKSTEGAVITLPYLTREAANSVGMVMKAEFQVTVERTQTTLDEPPADQPDADADFSTGTDLVEESKPKKKAAKKKGGKKA